MADNLISGDDRLLYRSITRRYTLAVVIIALLSSGAFYTLRSALSDSESTAYIVNLSGRQRMLSQHIALDAHRLYRSKYVTHENYTDFQRVLTEHIQTMALANHQLSTGNLSENNVVDLSPMIWSMYFDDMNLSERVTHYLEFAKGLESTSGVRVN